MRMLGEIALAQAARKAEPTSKTNITRNAAGQWQFSVEVAHADPFEATTAALKIAEILKAAYPRQNGEGK